jgi:hypothetical protein
MQGLIENRSGLSMKMIRCATEEMKAIATGAVVGALASMVSSASTSADARIALTIRVYNTSEVPAPELLAARRAVESTFQDTGVDLIFRLCGRPIVPGDSIDPCSEPLKPLEVVVRIINAPAFSPSLHPEAYGVAYVVKETNRGWLATAFSDRIRDASTRVGVETGTLLGLVVAHEVAHLLLGVGYHGETGVMRAEWPDALLGQNTRQWHFTTLEAAKLRLAASIPF